MLINNDNRTIANNNSNIVIIDNNKIKIQRNKM